VNKTRDNVNCLIVYKLLRFTGVFLTKKKSKDFTVPMKNIVIKPYSTSHLIHLENATDQLYVRFKSFPRK